MRTKNWIKGDYYIYIQEFQDLWGVLKEKMKGGG